MPKEKMKYQDCLAQKIEYDGKNYWYEYMQGTSMAAPTVTGIYVTRGKKIVYRK